MENGRIAKWGIIGRTEQPLLQILTHHIHMLTYFTNYNHLRIVLTTKTTYIMTYCK